MILRKQLGNLTRWYTANANIIYISRSSCNVEPFFGNATLIRPVAIDNEHPKVVGEE
jgi:hypothetical protein